MYLQVHTGSDITNANGVSLDVGMRAGHHHLMSSRTLRHHVNQAKPSEKTWLLWRKANRLWAEDGETLNQPLGRWLHTPSALSRAWPAYRDENLLYVRNGGDYISFQQMSTEEYEQFEPVDELPSESVPVSIIPTDGGFRVQQPTLPQFTPLRPPPPRRLHVIPSIS